MARIRSSAIILRKKKILLIHRRKNSAEYWVLPGGGIENGETAEEAVKREVKEETGLNAQKLTLKFWEKTAGGQQFPYFLCEVNNGNAILGGVEAEANCEENNYHLEWIKFEDFNRLNFFPRKIKHNLLKLFSHK